MNIIIDYLKELKKVCSNKEHKQFYDWILTNGKLFTKTITPKEYRQYKLCYYNSQTLALDGEGKYYEGWGTTKAVNFPIEHGFIVKRNKVLDTTWRDGEIYFGIHIPIDYIRNHWIKNRMAESLLYIYYRDKNKRRHND